ncbi:hypothetical protein PENTCL1PPCAC_24066 [Pristionchus entomophagus]|uniref:RING-type domain-containing protein n=1 Tax=Pristionchus entomophagus TaxID=358040 RepID=A0AAV5U5T7_9BILA|nr:hypothetical protein PENTCL1PPCAC_24066 [Pristionchus entomophagus]
MAAAPDFTLEQWQLFWDLKEMFPNVSGAALKQHLDKAHEEITELILTNQLPAGDQFIGDSMQPVVVHEPAVMQQPPQPPAAPVRPVGLMNTAPPRPQPAVDQTPPLTPRTSSVMTPVTTGEQQRERSKICDICKKSKERVAHCHFIDVDPYHIEEPDDAEHCVCVDCIKLRYMRQSLEVAEKGSTKSLFCLVKKCSRVICRDLLLAIVDKPAMVEWMLGSHVSLREASVRQIDREKKRIRDEEPQMTPGDKLRFENILDLVDEEAFVATSKLLPDACFSWILDNFDFGLQNLIERQTTATKRKLKRRDKAGVTHLVESRLKLQTTFTCTVCYEEFRSHLAVSCVVGPTASTDEETHSFCADCVRGYAGAALSSNVIVPSGIGIKCMQPRCTNILMRAHIEQVLDERTLAALDPHFADEAIIAAGLQAEKCQRCPFAAIIVEPPEQHPVFACRRDTCRHQYCRLCGRVWDKNHEGKTCKELDPEFIVLKMAEKLNEMLIHRCPRCNKAFEKIEGCNKITCPCGQLSCFVCKQAVEGYDHFQDRNAATGKCPLWEDPTTKERANAAALLNQEIAAAGGEVADALRRLQ